MTDANTHIHGPKITPELENYKSLWVLCRDLFLPLQGVTEVQWVLIVLATEIKDFRASPFREIRASREAGGHAGAGGSAKRAPGTRRTAGQSPERIWERCGTATGTRSA